MSRNIIIKESDFINIVNKFLLEQDYTRIRRAIVDNIYDIIDNISNRMLNRDFDGALGEVVVLHIKINDLSQNTRTHNRIQLLRRFASNLERRIERRDMNGVNMQLENILDILPKFSR
jgi:hypothetical protein